MACSKSPAEFSLQELYNCIDTYKTDEEILEYLVTQSQRVEATINRNDLSADLCYQILRLISKGLKCESKTSLVIELLNIVRHSQLLRVCINNVLHKCEEQFEGNNLLQLLLYIMDILNEILKRMPSSIEQYLGLIVVIKKVAENQRKSEGNLEFDEILSKTNFLRNSAFLELSKPHSIKKSLNNQIERKPPPNNFREIPILPSKEDIFPTSDVYLRPIIAKGSYKDLDHYLDVQFRLYREDCVSPLRDGIAEYVTQISGGQDVHRLQDVRLYKKVNIINKEVTLDGTVYWVKLDQHHSKRIRWETSKRLMYGSLVCLSPDNFRTLYFAIVVKSDRDVLESSGTIKVQFSNEVIPFTVSYTNLTMVETTAYFEVYRHVLSSLQKIQSGDLPFERYIVHCKRDILPPSYLENDNVSYDLFPVQAKTDISLTMETDHNLHRRDHVRNDLTIKHIDKARMKNVKILTNDWPSADNLHLDLSQLEAFRSALTKEFVLIQGPPGTGKTHVGLQIAKTLLHNRQIWMSGNKEDEHQTQPMLVVCFTNHALDQFMEGIVGLVSHTGRFEVWKNQIVRVGGRCNNKTIDELSLKKKRNRVSDSRVLYDRLNNLQRNIALLKWRLRKSEEVIFGEILKETVVEKEFEYLFEPLPSLEPNDENGNHFLPLLFKWLGVTKSDWISKSEKTYTNQQSKNKRSMGSSVELNNPFTTELLYPLTYPEAQETAQNVLEDSIDVKSEVDRVTDDRQIEKEDLFVQTEFDENLGLDVSMQLNHILKIDNLPREKLFTEILTQQANEALEELQKPDALTESEFQHVQITNIWKMSCGERWKLYRYWLHKYRENTNRIISYKEEQFEKTVEDYKSEKDLEDEKILRQSTVIAMTTTGAARYQDILRRVGPKIILVEEAAEVLEAHIIATLSYQCEHLILIGDHKQLEPKPAVFELAKKYNLSLSIFERMLKNGLSFHCLKRQHRMRPEISKMIRHIYPMLEDNENVLRYDNIAGVKKNVYFINHGNKESYDDDGRSYSNLYEAEFIVQLCRYLIKQGYEKSQITVLAAYSGQMFRLRILMPKTEFEGVCLSVLDNFQGEENDIIVLSLVRNNEKGEVGFLKRENRIGMALSRAKTGLYIIGNLTMLSKASELWKRVFIDLDKIGAVGKSLPLYCQNHPKAGGIMAKKPLDFEKAPDGGCLLKCDFRLPCGHACRLKCHPVDTDHTEYICKKPCLRECENAHKCQKLCHNPDNCGCPVKIEKDLLCNHKAIMKCCEDPCQYKCETTVQKSLKCGHSVQMFCCKNPDTYNCLEEITVMLPRCNHDVIMQCGESNLKKFSFQCKKVVQKTFPCGHMKDVMCFEAGFASCQYPCNKQCENGHTCKQTCHYRTECQCSVKIEKYIPQCRHIQKVKCHENPDSFDCIMVVAKEVPTCGHMQNMPCYLNPKLSFQCKTVVQKTFQCRHMKDVMCFEAGYASCQQPCKKQCENGHTCKQTCHYRTECQCSVKIEKSIPQCGHIQKMKCHENPDSFDCLMIVAKEVPTCGHMQDMPCYLNPELSHQCKKVVQKTFPCGHLKNVMCFEAGYASCQQPCKKQCENGHICKQTCHYRTECQCSVKIEKLIPKCGHIQRMKCHDNPDSFDCHVIVAKEVPTCGHMQDMPCYLNPKLSYRCKKVVQKTFSGDHVKKLKRLLVPYSSCQQPCKKQCENGHTCKEICHYKTKCQCRVEIEKSIPKCGHIQKMKCEQNPDTFDCRMIVAKKLPKCGHMQDMPCYLNPKLHRCTELVEKTGSCKHLIKVECSISQRRASSYCEELVTKKLLSCSHTQLFPCNKSPSDEKCNEMVEIKNPICGHYAQVPCNENPERHPRYLHIGFLNTRRNFQYPECKMILQLNCKRGHSREVPCSKQHISFCQEICEEVLECGHKCDDICGQCDKRSAHNKCITKVTKRCSNGHETKMPCAAVKYYTCNFSCNQILTCGHKCSGTCFQCNRGTFHIPCKHLCHRKQICGHACRSPCGGCEPCTKPCRKYCSHGPCKHRCSDPCLQCQKPCSWSCIHLNCTRLCYEICNRRPCIIPCSKKLSCGHNCLGFCGEPCPYLCRICDRRQFDQIKTYKVGYSNSKVFLVFLPDCGHTFNATYIDSYVENGRDTLSEISSNEIRCPLCKTPIEWHPRYGNVIKQHKTAIQSIKYELKDSIKAFQHAETNTVVPCDFLQKFESFCDYYYCTDVSEIEQFLSHILPEAKALLYSIQLAKKSRKPTQQQIKDLNSCMVAIAIQWLVLFYLTTHKDIPYGSKQDAVMEDESNSKSNNDVLQELADASNGLMLVEDGRLKFPNSLTSKDLEMVKGMPSLQRCSDQFGFVNAGNAPLTQEPKINFHQSDWMICEKGHAWPVATNILNCQKCEEQKLAFQETKYDEFDDDVVKSEDHQREIVNDDDGTSMKKKYNRKIKVQQSKSFNKKYENAKRIQIDSKLRTNVTIQKDGKADENENETMTGNFTRMSSSNGRRGVSQRGRGWSSKRRQDIGNNETTTLQLNSSVKHNWRGSHDSVGENNIERGDKTWREGGSNRRGRGQQSNVLIFENSTYAAPKPLTEEGDSNRPGRGSGYMSVEEKSECRQGDREQENAEEKRQCRNSMNRPQKRRNTQTRQSWRKGGRGRGGNTRY